MVWDDEGRRDGWMTKQSFRAPWRVGDAVTGKRNCLMDNVKE